MGMNNEVSSDEVVSFLKRYIDLFGKNTPPEELQRRLECAIFLQKGAEQKVEEVRKQKTTEDPLAIAVFIASLEHTSGHIGRALERTRSILAQVDQAGGLKDPHEDHSKFRENRMENALVLLGHGAMEFLASTAPPDIQEWILEAVREGLGLTPEQPIPPVRP